MTSWILYDGDCGLCAHSIRFIRRHARDGRYRYAALQSPRGRELAKGVAEPGTGRAETRPGSVLLVRPDGRVFDRSAAAVRIACGFRFPWNLLAAWWIVPRPLRDAGYRLIARYRYRWFGVADACALPD